MGEHKKHCCHKPRGADVWRALPTINEEIEIICASVSLGVMLYKCLSCKEAMLLSCP